ncbi:MAG: flagellar biosynthesis anti-sigma factor FlgM [Aquincola sp.]|nr:flagellar biosynthesis anti-sigma factor FlgM [Aquincola sp.]MDH4290032.1 flagellar biosynthesis anti-sigma factor FlgM [Aquincola sp.]MDH5329078.1 flagellar biosynthesis anti-sigma factor FlgM [Aquincola sp.]
MKIGQVDNAKPIAPTTDARQGAAKAGDKGGTPGIPAEASTKVELSSAATALAAAAGDNGDFDAAKVERIAQAIRDGKFEVNAEAIADKLLAHTRDLLNPAAH